MVNIKIIIKGDIPTPSDVKPVPDWLLPILDKLQSLSEGMALQITTANTEEAKILVVRLTYFRNKRGRKYKSNMPLMGYRFSQRRNFVFVYRQ